jgi:hypothetical protein
MSRKKQGRIENARVYTHMMKADMVFVERGGVVPARQRQW